MKNFVSLLILAITFMSCEQDKQDKLPFEQPPEWSREAIWYQIFVERFYNGDDSNDPSYKTVEGHLNDRIPKDWSITDWSHNWYAQEDWAEATGLDFSQTVFMRRYGGDLQGVMDKIDFLKELGITAIYFNPLNDAPSLHKFDARNYHHIDVNFGPDPEGDMKIIAEEDPHDPSTWQWTSADKLFLTLVERLHEEGIRVVVDFSWNHTGRSFWAFRDILEKGEASDYVDWYDGEMVTNEETGETYYDYNGWIGIKHLPEWRKVDTEGKKHGHPYEGDLHPDVKKHIFDVCRRWLDPMGTSDISKGIDGMRLDVAEHVPMGFWRDFRKFVREINPEFYLVGENWWTDWPDVLMDARPWVQGDVFDAVMHYQWYKVARGFFAQTEDIVASEDFSRVMDSVYNDMPFYTQQAMMNMAASHDSPRLLTSFFNKGKYKYNCKPRENPGYLTGPPDAETYERVKLFLLHQFTFVGSPQIWNGDELGMWGSDDPDNRKPLWWPGMTFENETASPFADYEYNVEVGHDPDMLAYYKDMTRLRKKHPVLTYGELEWIDGLPQGMVGYKRKMDDQTYTVLINCSPEEVSIKWSDNGENQSVFRYSEVNIEEDRLKFNAFSGIVIHMH